MVRNFSIIIKLNKLENVNGDNKFRIVSIARDSPLNVVTGVTTPVTKINVTIITKKIIMIIM